MHDIFVFLLQIPTNFYQTITTLKMFKTFVTSLFGYKFITHKILSTMNNREKKPNVKNTAASRSLENDTPALCHRKQWHCEQRRGNRWIPWCVSWTDGICHLTGDVAESKHAFKYQVSPSKQRICWLSHFRLKHPHPLSPLHSELCFLHLCLTSHYIT